MSDRTPSKKITYGRAPGSVQNRGASINSSDLRAMGVVMVPKTESKSNSAAMAGRNADSKPEVISKRQKTPPSSIARSAKTGEPSVTSKRKSSEQEVTSKPPPSMMKGGKIKKEGTYYLHKGEVVVPSDRVLEVDKSLKKDGKKVLKK